MNQHQAYVVMKFQECVTKTPEKLVELSKKKKRGKLIVGSSVIYLEDSENELHSCFYLDREKVFGNLWNDDSEYKLWEYRIRNFENYGDRKYLTAFRFYDGFFCMFKLSTAKKFVKEVREEVAKMANLKLSFVSVREQFLMKIVFSRQ